MKLAIYTHLHRTYRPTGVGKHIINMTRGFHSLEGDRMTVFTSEEDLNHDGEIPVESPLSGLAVRSYPQAVRMMERLWVLGLGARVERWVGDCEWLYSPAEVYVRAKRVKVATTCHCVNWFEPTLPWYMQPAIKKKRMWMAAQFPRMFSGSDIIFAVSEFLKGRIVTLFGIDPAKIHIVGNGVEHVYFELGEKRAGSPEAPRERERPYVLVVGGLTERKGGDATLDLARVMREKLPDVEMIVVGESEPPYIEAAKSHPNVVHVGYRDNKTLPALMKNAVAMSFLSVYETFGIPAAEAMAAGVPVVVSNLGALPEIVGDAGIIADMKDPGATVAAIGQVMSDEVHRSALIERGRRRARLYTWGACVERVRSVLNV